MVIKTKIKKNSRPSPRTTGPLQKTKNKMMNCFIIQDARRTVFDVGIKKKKNTKNKKRLLRVTFKEFRIEKKKFVGRHQRSIVINWNAAKGSTNGASLFAFYFIWW